MQNIIHRIKYKAIKILRDNFGFFYPLGNQTVNAVKFALSKNQNGHYYEFGLYQGYTFCEAVKHSPAIHHFGFDSFEGMPANQESEVFYAKRFSVSYDRVIKNLLKNKAFSHKEHLIRGFFSESLDKSLQEELKHYPAAVVLIDSDLYQSAVEVLEFIKSILQNGTIVIFDDWHFFDSNAGEQRALREFLQREPKIIFNEIKEFKYRKMFSVEISE